MFYQYRFILVIAILGLAAYLATEKGKLPLALRGLRKIMRRDSESANAVKCNQENKESNKIDDDKSSAVNHIVPAWKRLLAFILVLLAFVLSVIGS